MQRIVKCLAALLAAALTNGTVAHAQLVIQKGANITTNGAVLVTLQDADLINNDSIYVANGKITVVFSGIGNNYISGGAPIYFNTLQMAKTGQAKLLLNRNVNVTDTISFVSGVLDLNGNNILLQQNAMLVGESDDSYITGITGGYVERADVLNAPNQANPGNLGINITSTQNLGTTTIRRGHTSQQNALGQGNSVFRYFDVIPANNTALGATVRLHYFDHELDGLDKGSLVIAENVDGTRWANKGESVNDATNDFVEQTGIDTVARFTLSSQTNQLLPVVFTAFAAQCYKASVQLYWSTSSETNSKYFMAQSSSNGVNWLTVATVPAAGQSRLVNNYTCTDAHPQQGLQLYRVVAYDNNGQKTQTSIIKTACGEGDNSFLLYPNPVTDVVNLSAILNTDADINVSIYSMAGAQVYNNKYHLLKGSNQTTISLKNIAAGVYMFVLRDGSSGKNLSAYKIIKSK